MAPLNNQNKIKPYQRFNLSKTSLSNASWNRYKTHKTCATTDNKPVETESQSESETDIFDEDNSRNNEDYTTTQKNKKEKSLTAKSKACANVKNVSNCQRSAKDQTNTSTQRKSKKKAATSGKIDSDSPKLKKLESLDQVSFDSPVQQQKFDSKELSPGHSDCLEAELLQSAKPKNLIGRELELNKLEKFIESHMKNQSSGSMYIYGAPGSGKTACLSKVMSKPEFQKAFKIIYIDCRSVVSMSSVYSKLCQELQLKKHQPDRTFIQNYLSKSHAMLLLILHEMDQLKTRSQTELCALLEWPSMKNSKLVVIGTASSSDLIDKLLPKLIVAKQFQPSLLHFQSY